MSGFGVVLGAGGNSGRAFHAGALAALVDTLDIDAREARIIVGTSAGAPDAAMLRAGISPQDLFMRVTKRACSVPAEAVFARLPEWTMFDDECPEVAWRPASPARLAALVRRPWGVLPLSFGTIAAALMPVGQRPTEVIERGIAELHLDSWPAEDLWVCAVRLHDGRRVVFGRDASAPVTSVARAVAASCSVPGFFAPVVIDAEPYVDGGMYSPSNADVLAGYGLDFIVISSPQTMDPHARHASRDSILRASCRILLRHEAGRVARSGAPVLVLEPTGDDIRVMGAVADSMSQELTAEIALQAYESTVRRLTSGPLARIADRVARQHRLKRSAS